MGLHLINVEDIDDAWMAFKSTFIEIMSKCIPKKSVNIRPSIAWLNITLVRKIRKRNYLYQRSKRFHSPYYLAKYKHVRNELVKELRAAKPYVNLSVSGSIWKLIRTISKPSTSIPDLIVDDRIISCDSDKASALNLYFSRCFNSTVPPLSDMNSVPFTVSADLKCSPADIYKIIKSWNSTL